MPRTNPNIGPEFVQRLISLTDQDKLVWQEHNFGKKQDSSIAYFNPWMFCLDTGGRHPVLQVAMDFNFFTELEGLEYNLSALDLAISRQCRRSKMARQPLAESIAEEKIKKFGRDKLLHERKENRRRLKILAECSRTLIENT